MCGLDKSGQLLRGISPSKVDPFPTLKLQQLYCEQAVEYGPLLNLKVAQKRSKAGLPSIPMVGFPSQIAIISY